MTEAGDFLLAEVMLWLMYVTVAVTVVVTYLAGSEEPLMVNGTLFEDGFWLKVTDMLIVSSVILIIVAAGFVCFGTSGMNRKIGNRVHTKKA